MGQSRYAIIVAGGNGSRMGSEIPKQFLLLDGRPVLMHTMEAFRNTDLTKMIIVLPLAHRNEWEELCRKYRFEMKHECVRGGETRFHSVRNGLAAIGNEGLVLIHDGVRPLVSSRIISEVFRVAEEKGNAVAAVRVRDSIREALLTGGTRNANRENYYLVQTPQGFHVNQIKAAYDHAGHYNFTDDAGVLEEYGEKIHLTEGDYRNIKITTPGDLEIASILLKNRV